MHARMLNGISFVTGVGISLGIFLSIAQFLGVQEQAMPPRDDLETLAMANLLPPPPLLKPDDQPSVVPEMPDAVPLGIREEPSASPVKIPPSPPAYEELLPVSRVPPHVVTGMLGLDIVLKPTIDLTLDQNHVFQRSEVDKPPILISRPEPSVPAHLRGKGKGLSVMVVFVVDTHGVAGTARTLQSSDNPEFDAIITANVGEWRFAPAIKKGKPVRCMVQQLVRVQWGDRDPFSL
jgi:TonB family protein